MDLVGSAGPGHAHVDERHARHGYGEARQCPGLADGKQRNFHFCASDSSRLRAQRAQGGVLEPGEHYDHQSLGDDEPGAERVRSDPSGNRKQAALGGIAVPVELETTDGTLSFISTTTVFGTAVDISLAELAIETFFPTDTSTARLMRRLSEVPESG